MEQVEILEEVVDHGMVLLFLAVVAEVEEHLDQYLVHIHQTVMEHLVELLDIMVAEEELVLEAEEEVHLLIGEVEMVELGYMFHHFHNLEVVDIMEEAEVELEILVVVDLVDLVVAEVVLLVEVMAVQQLTTLEAVEVELIQVLTMQEMVLVEW